jgi:hypothetical protein
MAANKRGTLCEFTLAHWRSSFRRELPNRTLSFFTNFILFVPIQPLPNALPQGTISILLVSTRIPSTRIRTRLLMRFLTRLRISKEIVALDGST